MRIARRLSPYHPITPRDLVNDLSNLPRDLRYFLEHSTP